MTSLPNDPQTEQEAFNRAGVEWRELAQVLNKHALVSITDTAGRITYVNQMFCQVSGYSKEELLGQNHRLIKSNRHPTHFYRELWADICSGKTWRGEICNRTKDGREYWVESTIMPITDECGKPRQFVSIRTEITRQKEVEERMRLSQAYANIGTWDWDIASGKLFWSEKIWSLFGYSEGELATSYENFLNAIHPDDRGSVEAAVNAALESDTAYDIEHRVIWPDGSVHWVLERGAVRRNDAGAAVQMLGIVQDINARKLAELELVKQRDQLSQAQQIAKLVSWHTDLTTREFEASENIYDIYGINPEQQVFSIDNFKNTVHPDDKYLFDKIGQQIQTTGHYDVTHRIIWPSGEVRHVHVSGHAIKNEHNELIALSGVIQDISNRVDLEHRLKETEQRFTFAVEGAGDGVWEYNFRKGLIECSPQCMGMLGFEQKKVVLTSADWLALIHPDDAEELSNQASRYLSGASKTYNAQVRMRCNNGEYKWILCRGTAIEYDKEGLPTRLIGVNSDISDIKRKEAELVAARNAADKANQAKSEFLSNMSHELRTPLNAIIGFGQLLELDSSLTTENSQYVHEVVKAGGHLLQLINEILDLAKVESGRVMLSIETVQLQPVLSDVFTLVRPLAEEKSVSLELTTATDASIAVDRVRLKQILINLLSNAIKYNRPNGMVRVGIDISADNRVCISVEDTGVGIDAAQLQQIFEPFNRLSAENSTVEGTGIGLTITRQLVEMMNGEIGVDSTPGRGSRFYVTFPLYEAPDSGDGQSDSALADADATTLATSRKVLYIDDNPSNLLLVKNILAAVPNIELVDTHSPELGLDMAKRITFDLILLDINMPGINGFELLRLLKALPALESVPVIAVSASAMASDIKRGIEAGFSDYISKPFDVRYFRQLILEFLTRHHP